MLAASPATASRIYTIEVKGPIFAPVVQYLTIALDQAEKAKADALLFELDTPGGSLDATKDLVQAILGAAVPVIVYVAPSGAGATSAGTFITLAAHVAAMAPGTTIGAAHPVMLFSGEPNPVLEKKAENYAVSFIEAIAEQRGRNVAWAQEAVRDSASITAEAALEKKVIDLVAPTRDKLLEAIDGRTVRLRGEDVRLVTARPEYNEIEMTLQQRFYFFLSQPTMIFLFLIGGIAAVYIEFTHPGTVAPGVTGVICLLLAAIGFSIVPVNLTGVALMALGVALLIAEIFVPSFGALGIGGIACLIVGSLLLFQTVEAPGLVVNRGIVAATAVTFAALLIGVGTLVTRSQRSRVAVGLEAGKVTVGGEIWDAVSRDGGTVEEGTEIEVVAMEGMRLFVVPRGRS